MLTHLADWHPYRGPLIALAVALGLALAGRFLRLGVLAAASGGAGVVAGWYVITGRLWVVSPAVSIDELAEFAVLALLLGLLTAWRGPGVQALLGMLLVALAAAWFLSGAPRHEAALRAGWPVALGVAVVVLLVVRLLTDRVLEPRRLALLALTLAASLHVAGTAMVWVQLALVPGLAALAMLALPPMAGLAGLPIAADVAALGCLVVLALGRLPRMGFGSIDAAALSPLLAVWLAPRLAGRMGNASPAALWLAALLSGAIAVGCVWLVQFMLHH